MLIIEKKTVKAKIKNKKVVERLMKFCKPVYGAFFSAIILANAINSLMDYDPLFMSMRDEAILIKEHEILERIYQLFQLFGPFFNFKKPCEKNFGIAIDAIETFCINGILTDIKKKNEESVYRKPNMAFSFDNDYDAWDENNNEGSYNGLVTFYRLDINEEFISFKYLLSPYMECLYHLFQFIRTLNEEELYPENEFKVIIKKHFLKLEEAHDLNFVETSLIANEALELFSKLKIVDKSQNDDEETTFYCIHSDCSDSINGYENLIKSILV